MNTTEQKAQFLLNELNFIDDRFLYESTVLFAAARKKRKKNITVALICACLALCMLVLPTMMAAGLGVLIFNNKEEPPHDSIGDAPPEKEILTEEEIDHTLFFSGSPMLIWQQAGSSEYCMVTLDADTFRRLSYLSTQGYERDADDPAPQNKIWLCDGEGFVRSPYLENTPGNLYYATLFDYDPELVLSNALENDLKDLMS